MKSIIVMGGGIGALTAAHELSKYGYGISVYERNDCLGGLARSKFNTKNLPCSYSWRVYGKYYTNLRQVLSEIPLIDASNKSVIDNLIDINGYYICDYSDDMFELFSTGFKRKVKTLFKILMKFNLKDLYIFVKTFLHFLFICEQRLESYDKIAWKDYMADLSDNAKNFIVRSVGPFYGMDIDNVSVFSAHHCFLSVFTYLFMPTKLSVMNAPTNIAWFDHWQAHLESKGVKFYLNHLIDSIDIKEDSINEITVLDKTTNQKLTLKADYYICGLGIEEVANKLATVDDKGPSNYESLAQKSRQIQLSIQLYLDDRLIFPDEKSILWLPESPWALIIESQLTLWRNYDYVQTSVKDILSVGICDWSTKGLKIKKAFIDCNFEEIIEEVWFQIQMCPGLNKLPTINGRVLKDMNILDHYIWESFHVNSQHKIDTWEPKYSNNVDCYNISPTPNSNIKNLYFATAYTKNSTKTFSMESAAESGLLASRALLASDNVTTNSVKIVASPRVLEKYLGWARKIDNYFYNKSIKN